MKKTILIIKKDDLTSFKAAISLTSENTKIMKTHEPQETSVMAVFLEYLFESDLFQLGQNFEIMKQTGVVRDDIAGI